MISSVLIIYSTMSDHSGLYIIHTRLIRVRQVKQSHVICVRVFWGAKG